MPGPQGPEANKKTEGNTPLTVSKSDNNAVDIGKEEPPKQSPIQDTNQTTQVVNSNAAPQPSSSSQQASGSASNAKTTTTSNQGVRRVGYRYYRDLGQN